jgi:hypothetical protein
MMPLHQQRKGLSVPPSGGQEQFLVSGHIHGTATSGTLTDNTVSRTNEFGDSASPA